MKRIPLLLYCLLLFITSKAQMTDITLDYPYQPTLLFLDSVENKLLGHLNKIFNHKVERDVNLFEISYVGKNKWTIPADNTYYPDTCIKEFHKTNQYRLDIKWDNNLDTGYIIGFSRLYYIKKKPRYDFEAMDILNISNSDFMSGAQSYSCIDPRSYNLLSKTYLSPMFEIPLKDYSFFLSKKEIQGVYKEIKYSFISQFNDVGIYTQGLDGITERYIEFDKTDSLAQMPWSHWASLMQGLLKFDAKNVYKDVACLKALTEAERKSDLLVSEKLYDSLGHFTYGGSFEAAIRSIIVAEKWTFDTTSSRLYVFCPSLIVSRKIIAIGFVPDIPKGYKDYGHYPLWVKYDDVEAFCKERGQQLDMYNVLINSALFRKLGLFY